MILRDPVSSASHLIFGIWAIYYRAVGWRAMNWVWAGAILYTLGAICELTKWPTIPLHAVRFGFHEVFHLMSAGASAAFFLFVARYVIPYRAPLRETTD